jgi:Glycosyl transferase family 2
MSLPRVSCLIATYNFAPFLARSIESALEHDYPQELLEIIVVDDGSVDDTPAVVAPYLDRITYIRKPNGGLLSTVNRMLDEATGELIALLSGDDIWLPGRVRLAVEQFTARPQLGLVYCDMRVIDDHDRTVSESWMAAEGMTAVTGRPVGPLMHENVVAGGGLMVRASLLDQFAPIPAHAGYEDWWIALRVAQVAEIDYLSVPLYGYRKHGSNRHLLADDATMCARLAEQLPMRRWILTELESDIPSAQEWFVAYEDWARILGHVARGQNADLRSLAPVSEADREAARRAMAAAGEHLGGGELDEAARECVRALGHDPFSQEPGHAITAIRAALDAEDTSLAPPQVRAFVTLADAEELIAAPALLRAYADTFGGRDDASLIVLVAPDRIPALSGLVDQTGLGSDGACNIVGVPVDGPGAGTLTGQLAGRVNAVLSRRAPQGALACFPWADERDTGRLRGYAERRWSRLKRTEAGVDLMRKS